MTNKKNNQENSITEVREMTEERELLKKMELNYTSMLINII